VGHVARMWVIGTAYRILFQTLNRVYLTEDFNADWRVLKIILNERYVSM